MNRNNGVFRVTFLNKERNLQKTLELGQGQYFLDISQKDELDLPYSCSAGRCTTCVGKVIEGEVEQTTEALQFLTQEQVDAGYILTCAAYPISNCTILTHQEEELF